MRVLTGEERPNSPTTVTIDIDEHNSRELRPPWYPLCRTASPPLTYLVLAFLLPPIQKLPSLPGFTFPTAEPPLITYQRPLLDKTDGSTA